MKLQCQNRCAIESLLKSDERAATTLESGSRRRERGGRTRDSRSHSCDTPDVREAFASIFHTILVYIILYLIGEIRTGSPNDETLLVA